MYGYTWRCLGICIAICGYMSSYVYAYMLVHFWPDMAVFMATYGYTHGYIYGHDLHPKLQFRRGPNSSEKGPHELRSPKPGIYSPMVLLAPWRGLARAGSL